MKCCDICWETTGQPVLAVTQIAIGPVGQPLEVYDSCAGCVGVIKELLQQQPRVKLVEKNSPGRPRKNLTDRQGDDKA